MMRSEPRSSKILAENPLVQQWRKVIQENPGFWQEIIVFSSDAKSLKSFKLLATISSF